MIIFNQYLYHGNRCIAIAAPYSSYSTLLNHNCWNEPNDVRIDAPIHDAHDRSTVATFEAITFGFTKDGKSADNSCDNLISMLGSNDDPPTKQIHPANSKPVAI